MTNNYQTTPGADTYTTTTPEQVFPPVVESTGLLQISTDLQTTINADIDIANDLILLHKSLQKIAPILGISGNTETGYRVDYAETASAENIAAVDAFLTNWPTYRDKYKKLQVDYAQLDAWFNEQIASGFTTTAGFTLGLSGADITLLSGNYILAQAASAAGLPIPAVIDKNQVSHKITSINELTALMVEYGNYRANLSQLFSEKKALLDAEAASL
jgi:hypothetical protein